MRRRRAGLALAAALCAACGGPGSHAAPTPGGVALALQQYREDQAPRVVQVAVTTRDGLTVTRAQVHADGFADLPPTDVDAPVPAGQTVDVPVPYGAVQCGTPPGSARVRLQTSAGELDLVAQDPTQVLERVHRDECAAQQVLSQVRLTLTSWRPGSRPDELVSAVELDRVAGGARIAVTELQRNTLFAVTAPSLAVLAPGTDTAQQVLRVRPIARCNVHALAESKRATVFGLYVSVDGAEPVLVTVSADAAQRAQLLHLAGAGC